jgi:hypothetical protein
VLLSPCLRTFIGRGVFNKRLEVNKMLFGKEIEHSVSKLAEAKSKSINLDVLIKKVFFVFAGVLIFTLLVILISTAIKTAPGISDFMKDLR